MTVIIKEEKAWPKN